MLRYTDGHPERGERMIVGMMEAESTMQFTREDVRQSIKRVSAYGLQLRSQAFKIRLVRYVSCDYSTLIFYY
jgi:hypothetical protein